MKKRAHGKRGDSVRLISRVLLIFVFIFTVSTGMLIWNVTFEDGILQQPIDNEDESMPPVQQIPHCPFRTGVRDLINDPIVIFEPANPKGDGFEEMPNCPIRCITTANQLFRDTADLSNHGVGAYAPRHADRPCKHIKYMVNSMESEVNYQDLYLARINKTNFDWVSSYRLDSDNSLPYFEYTIFDWFRDVQFPKDRSQPGSATVVSFISNCGPQKRLKYIQSLMKYMPVENYGQCLRNVAGARYGKGDVMPKKKFVLVFENSETWDYSTEKLYDSLSLGSVPVVLGPPNVGQLVPDLHSYIDVKDFASPKHLSEYLKYLDEHDEEYLKYFEWKKRGFDPKFEKLLDMTLLHSRCRLCMTLAGIEVDGFLWYYKKKWIEKKILKYVPPAKEQPDWTKEYQKLERDMALKPGLVSTLGGTEFTRGIWQHWGNPRQPAKVLEPNVGEFTVTVSKQDYEKHLDLLKIDKPYKDICDADSGRAIRNMRELEYIFSVDYGYVWEPDSSTRIVYSLPMESCYDSKNNVAYVKHGFIVWAPPPTQPPQKQVTQDKRENRE